MLNVGLVGVGFMGWIHYLAYQRSKEAKLTAFVSRDPKKRAGDWRGIHGNFGPPGQPIDVTGIQTYEATDELLANDSIDVVDICLPPHLHAPVAIAALQAGKHVFCEKPLGLTSADCDRILDAARANDRQVMVAQVLPYIGPYQYALESAQDGCFGKPIGGYFKRVISNPDWIPDFFDPNKVGGPMVDLHVHDAHFIGLLFGKPKSIHATGRREGQVAKFAHALYLFEDPKLAVSASSGVIDQAGRPFTHGFEIHFERATLQFEFAAFSDNPETMPLKVLDVDGQVERPELPPGDDVTAFEQEIADMVSSIRSGTTLPRLSAQLARDAIHYCHCVQESVLRNALVHV